MYPFASLPENLAAFCGVLRRTHGFRVGPGELQDAARALEVVELSDERAVRHALAAHLDERTRRGAGRSIARSRSSFSRATDATLSDADDCRRVSTSDRNTARESARPRRQRGRP